MMGIKQCTGEMEPPNVAFLSIFFSTVMVNLIKSTIQSSMKEELLEKLGLRKTVALGRSKCLRAIIDKSSTRGAA